MSQLKLTPAQVAEARALLIADIIERELEMRAATTDEKDLDWLVRAASFAATGRHESKHRVFALDLARKIVASGL